MYILDYDYAALLLNIINLAVFIYLKNLRDPKSAVLFVTLINSLLTTILDILSSLSIGNPEQYPHWYSVFVTNLYYLLNNNKVFLYFIYVLILTGLERRFSKWKKNLISIPYAVTVVMILLNPITDNMFTIDSNLIYYRGTGLFVLYIIAFIYLLLGSLSAIRYKKLMDRSVFRALAAFIFIYILSLILQTLYPQLLIQSFSTSICDLLLIMVIQNRIEVMDGSTRLYNQTALYDKLQNIINSNTPASITLIMLEDATRISYTLGFAYLKLIIQEVAHFIRGELAAGEKYYIRNGCFALLSTNNLELRYSETKAKVTNRFQENWYINDLSITLSVKICQLKLPEQISSYSDVYDYIDSLITTPSSDIKDEQTGISEISFNTHKREQQVKKSIALAMTNHSFEVYYQPIYSVKDRCFLSAEALVRLRDPELGFIPPDEFIPLTERDGTINKLGLQIFEMVCSFLKHSELPNQGLQYIQINLSVVQCMQSNLMEQLTALLGKYDIRPNQICLEITETVAVNTPEVVRALFQQLDKQGMSFALDDYGSGFSNVNYLIELPFHYVKLDKGIIWNYFKHASGKIALEGTIAMMKSLNFELIAEGVETKEQADTLAQLGVNYLQGYYFSKPIPSEDFIRFMTMNNTNEIVSVRSDA